jgi:hypothetical protein
MSNSAGEEKKKAGKLNPAEPAKSADSDDLDRIRHILFGDQISAYDSRFGSLESRTRSDRAELRTDVAKRLAALETFVKGELGAISERIRDEREERTRIFRQISKEFRDGLELTEKRLAEYAAQADRELHAFREQFLAYSQTVRDEIHAAAEEESGTLPH